MGESFISGRTWCCFWRHVCRCCIVKICSVSRHWRWSWSRRRFHGIQQLERLRCNIKNLLFTNNQILQGEDENRELLLDANRVFYTPFIRSVSYIAAFTAVALFLGAFFTPCGMGPTYGLVTGGLLAGRGLRMQIEPNEQTIDGIVQRICEKIYPDILTCSFNMLTSDAIHAHDAPSNGNKSKNLISNSAS